MDEQFNNGLILTKKYGNVTFNLLGGNMRHIFIVNPIAGDGKYQKDLADSIHAQFKDKDVNYEVYFSKFKGDIQNYINNKCKDSISSVIYACGGDGTLHEVINSACKFDHINVGVIPCGSGNDFIKNFINYENFNSIEAQMQGEIVYLDLIKVNDIYASSVCNVGLDADAAFHMHKFKKLPFISGSTRYYLSVLYCLINELGRYLKISIDDNEEINNPFLLGVVANGQFYGGGYKCAPLAIINDGLMDLCLVDKISRFQIINLIGSYKLGNHLKNPKINKYITYKKCKHVKIKSNEPLNVCIDGEIYIQDEVKLTVKDEALKLWLPKGTKIKGNEEDFSALTQ